MYTIFDIELATKDGVSITIPNTDLTVTLTERWLW